MRAQAFRREERVGEVRGVVVDPELLFYPPPRLHPAHDRVAIGRCQSRVNGYVVQGIAVGEKPPTLRSARMLARERKLFRLDHHPIVLTRARSLPPQPYGGWTAVIGCYRGLVAVMTAGVYLAFDGGPDASRPGGAGIGPYDEIVLRGARAVGERGGFGKVIALRSAAGSWRDAESSSSESDQGASGRGDLRISATDGGVLVRFSDDEVTGHTSVPDLGPFAAVVVGTHEVRGDEQTLAVRVSRISPWQLTDRAGAGFQGATKEALIFVGTGHIASSQPREVALKPKPRTFEPEPAPAAADAEPSVWVERAKVAPNIYISRPDPKR